MSSVQGGNVVETSEGWQSAMDAFVFAHSKVNALLRRPRAQPRYVFRAGSHALFDRWIECFVRLVVQASDDEQLRGVVNWNDERADFWFVLVSWGCTKQLVSWMETRVRGGGEGGHAREWQNVVKCLCLLRASTSVAQSVIQANVPLWALAMHSDPSSTVFRVGLDLVCNGFLTFDWARNLLNKMLVFKANAAELWCPYAFMARDYERVKGMLPENWPATLYANTLVHVRKFFIENNLLARMRSFKRRIEAHEHMKPLFRDLFDPVRIEPFRRVVPLNRTRKAFFAKCATCDECPVCSEPLAGRKHFMLVCGHNLCTDCVSKISMVNPNAMSKCPLCRQRLMPLMLELFGSSTMFVSADLKDKEGRVVGTIELTKQPVEFVMHQELLVDVQDQDRVSIGLLRSQRGDVVSISEDTMP